MNLDPANDNLTYEPAIDIRELVMLRDVMETEGLGPNGAIMYALEVLENNMEWLIEKLQGLGEAYVLFDCPGQVELFTHHGAIKNITRRLQKEMDYRLVVVELADAQYITEPTKYISVLLLSLRSMLQFELPHVNVLSKIDTLQNYESLPFKLDYYTEVQDLSFLVDKLNADPAMKRYVALNKAVCDLVEDFGLVSYEVLDINDKVLMAKLLQTVDRAVGYMFASSEITGDMVWAAATRTGWADSETVQELEDRWQN